MRRSSSFISVTLALVLLSSQASVAFADPVFSAGGEYSQAIKDRWVSGQESFNAAKESVFANEEYVLKLAEYDAAVVVSEQKNAEADEAAVGVLSTYNTLARNPYTALGVPPIIEAMATDPENFEDAVWRGQMIELARGHQMDEANVAVELSVEAEGAKAHADGKKVEAEEYLEQSKAAEIVAVQKSVDSDSHLLSARNSLSAYISEANRAALRNSPPASRDMATVTTSTAGASETPEVASGGLVLAQQVVVDSAVSMWAEVSVPTVHETTLVDTVSTVEGYQRAEQALSLVGESYQTYSCDAFVAVFSLGDDLESALASTSLRESIWQAQPGDLVFFKNPEGKLYQAGIYVTSGLVVTSNASTGNVAVEEIDLDKVLAVGVPGAVMTEWSSIVRGVEIETEAKCGGVNAVVSTITSTWVKPFEVFQLSVTADVTTFAGVGGESVRAATRGVVNLPGESGVVEVFTESGLVLSYSGVADVSVVNGQPIASGQVFGVVGASGLVSVRITTAQGVSMSGEELFFAVQKTTETSNQDNPVTQNGVVPFVDVPVAASMGVYPTVRGVTRLASPWGHRGEILPGADPFHRGLDFAGPEGTAIYSVLDGKVLDTYTDGSSGNQVIVQHNVEGRTFFTVYKHMSTSPDAYVKKGDLISAGTLVGGIGTTGQFSTGNHLHLEVWVDVPNRDHHINPVLWLSSFGVS